MSSLSRGRRRAQSFSGYCMDFFLFELSIEINNFMAELNSTAPHARRGGRRSKKLSTRVDLTPMVDLGFLLITFFMVSTSWTKPLAATLRMPADGPPMTLGNNAALTLVALKDNKIFYYNGDLGQSLKEGSYGVTDYRQHGGIGDIIRMKQQAMDH